MLPSSFSCSATVHKPERTSDCAGKFATDLFYENKSGNLDGKGISLVVAIFVSPGIHVILWILAPDPA